MAEALILNDEFINNFFLCLEKKKLIVKEAAVKKERREYIKEKDFVAFVKENKDYIVPELNKVLAPKLNIESENLAKEILKVLVLKGFLLEAVPTDYDRKPKYPKHLNLLNNQDYGDEDSEEEEDGVSPSKNKKIRKFFVFNFNRPETKSYLWLTIVILLVLGVCMFPIWPLEVKLAIWWISWILLVLMIGIFTIRLFFYLLFFTIGYDFWIFPNLTDDNLGIIDSFKPFYSFNKRNETLRTIVIRVVIAITIGVSSTYIYQNPELVFDFGEHLQEIYSEVLDWGNEKIINYHNGTNAITIAGKSDNYRRLIEEEGLSGDF